MNNSGYISKKALIITVFTNGYLLNRENVDFFKKFDIRLVVSIDGTKKDHMMHRKFAKIGKNNSFFEKIIFNITNFYPDIKHNTVIHTVISPDNCENITNNLKFIRQLGWGKIHFYPSHQYWGQSQLRSFQKSISDFARYYISLFESRNIEEVFYIPFLHELISRNFKKKDCRSISLSQEGNFYLCKKFFSYPLKIRDKWKIGDFQNGIDVRQREKILKEPEVFLKKRISKGEYEKLIFCPFSFYFWGKIEHRNLMESLRIGITFSDIYRYSFSRIYKRLKNNPFFEKIYHSA